MDDLGLDIETALPWFTHEQDEPYVLVRVNAAHAHAWAEVLGLTVRRCYVSDEVVTSQSSKTGLPGVEVIAAALPDRRSTMSGDFGEILTFLYQAAQEYPERVVGPRKWRMKEDRDKPAPHSDVVQFVLPNWPKPSENDRVLCAEVKAKATKGNSKPIQKAIEDCKKDRTGRLVRTLNWLRARAILGKADGVSIAQIDRFINAIDDPQATRCFRAVAIVCASLVDAELVDARPAANEEYEVVVISVPELKATYEAVFCSAKHAVPLTNGDGVIRR